MGTESLREIREQAGWSRDKAAAAADVAYATCKTYELAPSAVVDLAKRARLDSVYARLREIAYARRVLGAEATR